jgi:2'-5' RNA ligase
MLEFKLQLAWTSQNVNSGSQVNKLRVMTENGPADKFRLFVAITVPDAVREEVLRVQREWQPLAPREVVRWTKPEQFHLTLRFLGDVASVQVAGLQGSLCATCAGTPPLHLRAQGVGFFPYARSPRVIWVGINDKENRLAAFQKKIESAIQSYTAEQGGDQFTGHVTLGRFKQYKHIAIRELVDRAESVKNRLFGEWTAREVEIIRSELLPAGPRYTSLAVCKLGQQLNQAETFLL